MLSASLNKTFPSFLPSILLPLILLTFGSLYMRVLFVCFCLFLFVCFVFLLFCYVLVLFVCMFFLFFLFVCFFVGGVFVAILVHIV